MEEEEEEDIDALIEDFTFDDIPENVPITDQGKQKMVNDDEFIDPEYDFRDEINEAQKERQLAKDKGKYKCSCFYSICQTK